MEDSWPLCIPHPKQGGDSPPNYFQEVKQVEGFFFGGGAYPVVSLRVYS